MGDNKYETILVGDQSRHVLGYLQDFLFPPERARSLVKVLSGGERSRLLLAKLFTKPSNVLVLDEPTNDLDIETLDLLEELSARVELPGVMLERDDNFPTEAELNAELDQIAAAVERGAQQRSSRARAAGLAARFP